MLRPLAVLLTAALVAAPTAAHAVTSTNRVMSVGTHGEVGDYDSGTLLVSVVERNEVDISGSGRFVAFQSEAGTLVGSADTNNRSDVFVRDRDADADGVFDEPGAVSTAIVSVGTYGEQEYGELSRYGSISRDGRFVAFFSYAALVPEDTNEAGDVYVRDRDTDHDGVYDEPDAVRTTRVSLGTDDQQGNNGSTDPEISANGRIVVFSSIATTLSPWDTDISEDVYARDRDTDDDGIYDEPGAVETRLVSGPIGSGEKPVGTNQAPTIAGNGHWIAWQSTAEGWDPTDHNHAFDIYVKDMWINTVTRVSAGRGGADSNQESQEPSMSDDGKWLAFSSQASNLVANDVNEVRDVFVVDLDPDGNHYSDGAGRVKRLSVSSTGRQANGRSTGPSISADGRVVVFESEATNIGYTSGLVDVYLRDRDADRDKVFDEKGAATTELVVMSRRNTQANGMSASPVISANRRWVGFSSSAENLVASKYDNHRTDVFVKGPLG